MRQAGGGIECQFGWKKIEVQCCARSNIEGKVHEINRQSFDAKYKKTHIISHLIASPAYVAAEQVWHQGSDVPQNICCGHSIVYARYGRLDLMLTGNCAADTIDNREVREGSKGRLKWRNYGNKNEALNTDSEGSEER